MEPQTQHTVPVDLRPVRKQRIVIVGGGTAGITVAAQLARALAPSDITIIEPSDKHYYQPLWTLVGGGVFPKQQSERSEASVIPRGVTWLRDAVSDFLPHENAVFTRDGKKIQYEYVVVAPGLQLDCDKVIGLKESLGREGVCSNYVYDVVDKTWEFIRTFTGGTAIFTHPAHRLNVAARPRRLCTWPSMRFARRACGITQR